MAKGRTEVSGEAEGAPGVAAPSRPRLVVRLGRGNVGGSTGLDAQVQLARAAGRDPIIFDGARNPTLRSLYPEAIVPETQELPDVKAAMTGGLDAVVAQRRSMGMDLGGGQDMTLASYVRDLDLLGFCEAMEVTPVAQFFLGPDLEDLRHALAIVEDGYFAPAQTIVWLNEGVMRAGQTPSCAFDQIRSHSGFQAWVKAGARPVYLKRLAPLDQIRRLGLTLNEAAGNVPNAEGKTIGMTYAWATRSWLKGIRDEAEAVGAGEWLL